ncbi:MAG: nucleotidyltransferase domain-containing protein [Fimbriimonadaceae bacterium]|nr:nucleotidyltransferase domain-containing protein [Fimbriimonadaceae bacterium]
MRDTILSELTALATAEGVRLLYAVESGSRAWGFASTDSDWDVRFLYVRPTEWYLTVDLDERRDVLERPISGDLDLNGWDFRKALRLLRKSNPVLLEWLHSPLVYHASEPLLTRLRAVAATCFAPSAGLYHYLHMAEGNFREYLRGETVRLKKYLYVIRPLLAMRWIERHATPPPVLFEALLADDPEPAGSPFRQALAELLERKMAGGELLGGPAVPPLHDFITRELERCRAQRPSAPGTGPRVEALNELFRDVLAGHL